jgi:hypothetical protein
MMGTLPGRSAEAEAIIGRLAGVEAVRVEWQGDQVERVHLLARGFRDTRTLEHDVLAVFDKQFGMALDPSKLSVVAVYGEGAESTSRPRLVSVSWTRTEGVVEVRCRLRVGRIVTEGRGQDPVAARAGARAALDAAESLVAGLVQLDMVELTLADTPVGPVALAVVRMGPDLIITGSSVADGDFVECAAKAALDAVNRRLLWMAMGPTAEAESA